jgi:hypothetical protein
VLLRALTHLPRRSWDEAEPSRRLLYLVGSLLVLSGVAHLGVWAVLGGSVDGPVSWRKPVAFGTSFGLTALTLAYVGGHLRVGRRLGWWLYGGTAYATAVEVLWVTVQRWRGVPSHFNFATALDTWLFYVMGAGSILVLILVMVVFTVLAFRRAATTLSMAAAIRAGMVTLLIAQVVGGAMINRGLAAAGTDVTPWAAVVALKIAHFAPMHAIQVLPALAWVLALSPTDETGRLRIVQAGALGYAGLVVAVLAQVFGGLPIVLAAALGVVAAGLLVAAAVTAVVRLRPASAPPTRHVATST